LNQEAVNILLQHKDEILAKIQKPGARLVFVGFADKCFIGPPYLAKKFNKQLSLRRARAVRDRVRDMLGRFMDAVPVKVLGMGFACANPKCNCSTPDMPECSMDRKVEIYVEYGEEKPFQCPAGRYWLAR
jgi:outer membrane protein OmpA-like peptidoglycan-associated protein